MSRDKDYNKGYTGRKWKAITPSDINSLDEIPRAIWTGSGGDVNMSGIDNNAEIFTLPANQIVELQPSKIFSSNTTATGLIGIY